MRRCLMLLAVIILATVICPLHVASANCSVRKRTCRVSTSTPPKPPADPGDKGGDKPTPNPSPTEPTLDQKQALAQWRHADAAYRLCLSQAAGTLDSCGPAPQLPLGKVVATFLNPGQVGAIAAARLQLPKSVPGIGPSPDLNPWKMAAVGYPLWLWLDGPTHVGPVSDSVAGLSVSLDAHVTDLTVRMGDGHTVHCVGTGRRWTNSVPTNAKSPACGYAYQKPSRPKGDYTVTAIATWSVRWTVNNQSGVITMPIAGETQLPVGELQVLVR